MRILPYFLIIALSGGCKEAAEGPVAKQEIAERQEGKSSAGEMEITANDVKIADDGRTTTFTGNVEMHNDVFRLKCDHLVVYMNEEGVETDLPFKKAVATGALVIVVRTNSNGERQVGNSREAVYEPLSGIIVLMGGPPTLQIGNRTINTTDPSSTIILGKDGSHQVVHDGMPEGVIPLQKRTASPVMPLGSADGIRASKLANQQAKQQFDKEPFLPVDFKKKIEGGSIVYTAVVPFAQVDELKAEIFFSDEAAPKIRLSVLMSRLLPERPSEKKFKNDIRVFPSKELKNKVK